MANSKDGSVRIFDGMSYALLQTLDYRDDADNLRYDATRQRVYVGYGSGALGEMDDAGNKVREIKLGSHPESFQLEKKGTRIFVNVPDIFRFPAPLSAALGKPLGENRRSKRGVTRGRTA